jgi:hypothetical protein
MEEREQKLQQIERDLTNSESKQKQLTAILSDKQLSMEAVKTDFAGGRLSPADRDMLLQMFEQRQAQEKQKLQEEQQRMGDLQANKQRLQQSTEPDRLLVSRAQFQLGDLRVDKPIFFNQSKNRPATEEEIRMNPNARQMETSMPSSIGLTFNERPVIAGIFAVWGLLMLYMIVRTRMMREDKHQPSYNTAVHHRTEVHRG